ncbi:MAG TPA: hypothetical protein VLH59_16810 [Ignavibacteriaceae bacterium]|nr:hypothetical protein [Ignavibacteriaceae bacterium]
MDRVKKVLLSLISLIFLTLNTCDENPINGDDTKPGRRDYTWKIDTLMTPAYTLVRRMWGSGPNDVWAILSGADLDETIWHYDGNSWTTDGIFRSIEPASIFGFAPDNIWLGGHQGEIWHYNGFSWDPITVLVASPNTTITWENIWGINPNNVYAVGAYEDHNLLNNNGVIAHYDGNSWELLNIQINNSLTKIYKDNITGYIVEGMRFGLIDTSKVFLFSPNKLTEIYSNMATSSYNASIGLTNDIVLISLGKEIYTYSNNKFNLFYTIEYEFFGGGIIGRSLKDIFLGMRDGIAHYNGSDVQYLFYADNPNTFITAWAIYKSEVFFSFYDFSNGKTYMYKGTLND